MANTITLFRVNAERPPGHAQQTWAIVDFSKSLAKLSGSMSWFLRLASDVQAFFHQNLSYISHSLALLLSESSRLPGLEHLH